jgi:hypothetical protein
MSQKIVSNIYIGAHQTQSWTTHWNNSGWQGNTIVQPQPLNTGASMTYTDPSVSMSSDGTYSFSYSATNNGPNSTYYNLELSNN